MPNHTVSAGGGALPTVRPTIFLALTPGLRTRLTTTVEHLIDLLDAIDADPDLEPEPIEDGDNGIADHDALLEIVQ